MRDEIRVRKARATNPTQPNPLGEAVLGVRCGAAVACNNRACLVHVQDAAPCSPLHRCPTQISEAAPPPQKPQARQGPHRACIERPQTVQHAAPQGS